MCSIKLCCASQPTTGASHSSLIPARGPMCHGAGLGIGKARAGRTGSSSVVSAGEGGEVAGHSGSPQGSCSIGSGISSSPGQVPHNGHALLPTAADGTTDVADGAANGGWCSNRSSSDHSEYSSHEVSGQSLSTTTSVGSECMHVFILHFAATNQAICMAR